LQQNRPTCDSSLLAGAVRSTPAPESRAAWATTPCGRGWLETAIGDFDAKTMAVAMLAISSAVTSLVGNRWKSAVPWLPRHGDGQPALPFSWSSLSCRASPQRWETPPASSPDRDLRLGQLYLQHETLPGLRFCTNPNG